MAAHRGPVEGRVVAGVDGVGVRAGGEQGGHGGEVAVVGGADKGGLQHLFFFFLKGGKKSGERF